MIYLPASYKKGTKIIMKRFFYLFEMILLLKQETKGVSRFTNKINKFQTN